MLNPQYVYTLAEYRTLQYKYKIKLLISFDQVEINRISINIKINKISHLIFRIRPLKPQYR